MNIPTPEGLALRAGLAVLAIGATMAAGAAAWDRTPIIGPHAKITALRAEVYQRTGEREAWKTRATSCERQAVQARDHAAGEIPRAEDDKATSAGDAFNQGYTAGRLIGRRLCGANNGQVSTDPGGGPGGLAGGVRDLSEGWNAGNYVPAPLSR